MWIDVESKSALDAITLNYKNLIIFENETKIEFIAPKEKRDIKVANLRRLAMRERKKLEDASTTTKAPVNEEDKNTEHQKEEVLIGEKMKIRQEVPVETSSEVPSSTFETPSSPEEPSSVEVSSTSEAPSSTTEITSAPKVPSSTSEAPSSTAEVPSSTTKLPSSTQPPSSSRAPSTTQAPPSSTEIPPSETLPEETYPESTVSSQEITTQPAILNPTGAPIDEEDPLEIVTHDYDTERQFMTLSASRALQPGSKYRIYLKFQGFLSDTLTGFYRVAYNKRNKRTRCVPT